MAASDISELAVGQRRTACEQEMGDAMAMDWHDTLMGSVLVISGGLTFAYTRAASKILLILTLIGTAATILIGVLLFFHLA
ncbi:MAG: hypothetical protein WAK82_28840 [Streptosporangiaceae bacterium]